ncbi:unnamed protein product [Mytilus coruscus]|uniref:Ig-like domain-containing protein n=1 Tax=Mytilus coruscus TaxID=42192 RepID=A0A6J8BDP7_MYTCO|nr:unnamed protein product [Mytilus coruscus]
MTSSKIVTVITLTFGFDGVIVLTRIRWTFLLFLVYWEVTDHPILHGRNVTLFCNTSAVGTQKTTWMKQSDVILHQSLSFYPDKYTGKEIADGSTLTIANVTFADVNVSYTCLSDVYSYEKVLFINNTDFILLPKHKEIKWLVLERKLYVQLIIMRICPVPTCTIMLNNALLPTIQKESMDMQDAFYHGTLNLTSQYQINMCEMNLAVVCVFGSSYSKVLATKHDKVMQNCNGSAYGFLYVGTVAGVGASFILLFTSCVYFIFRERDDESRHFDGRQSSVFLQNIRLYLHRLRCCDYNACRICGKKNASTEIQSQKESGKDRVELYTNTQLKGQREEKNRILESIEITNNSKTNYLTYPLHNANMEIDIHVKNANNSVGIRADYVSNFHVYNNGKLTVGRVNNETCTSKSQIDTAHSCVHHNSPEIVNLLV